jgi:hypothetical protein
MLRVISKKTCETAFGEGRGEEPFLYHFIIPFSFSSSVWLKTGHSLLKIWEKLQVNGFIILLKQWSCCVFMFIKIRKHCGGEIKPVVFIQSSYITVMYFII